jgi:hypothetical protein
MTKIAGSGSGTGYTPKCHGSATLFDRLGSSGSKTVSSGKVPDPVFDPDPDFREEKKLYILD